ncbi:MAG: Flagellar hook-basal body complex protein fliE [Gemmatimonadetes bacterium]|jgi:flagellar hook-basal body complex protein FliE|nr:Flagellar hook-basal body complex protein fliE [Gemmatimonadota bacterium]
MSLPIGGIGAVGARTPGIGGLGGLDTGGRMVPVVGPKGSDDGTSFGDTLTRAVNGVSDAQDTSSELTGRFLRGENVELHQVMAAGEEAGIALEMMIEIRNKVTEAYRTLVAIQS